MFKQTKKALMLSVLMLVVCLSMLLGTTYAWFTDSASSGSNVITTGNLDIFVEYTLDGENWKELDGSKDLFQKDLWEPGHTEVVALRITNKGTLALKYKALLNILGETTGKTKDGADIKLSELLTVSTLCQQTGMIGDVAVALAFDRENGIKYEATTKFNESKILREDENLLPGSAHYFIIKVDMPETIGNEANHDGVNKPTLTFGIDVLAAQYAHEEDSFGTQYDKDAEYPVIFNYVIDGSTSFDQIAEIFAKGGNIAIVDDITIANSENSRFNLTKDINLYIAEGKKLTFAKTTGFVGDKTITVYSGSIIEKQELWVGGNATIVFEGGEHTFNAFSATGNGKIVVNEGVLNCMGSYAGILGICFGENGQLIINGGKLNMHQPFNLNPNRCDNAYIEINGGEINLLENADKLFAVRNIMDKDRESNVLRGSSIKITGGVFKAVYPLDNTGDANAFIRNEDGRCDTTRVLDGNFYNGKAQYNCVVTGGTFYGCWTRTGETGGDGTEVCENTIAGFVAADYQITGDAINGYVVSKK